MKKLLSFLAILFLGVISSACVNTFAVHELNENAAKFSQAGDYKNAISRLEAAVDLDQSVFETRYNLALAYHGNEEYEKALQSINIAIKLSQNKVPEVYYSKGVILTSLADSLHTRKNEEGIFEEIIYPDEATKQEAETKFISYLKEANENYQIYLNSAPNAKDTEQVKDAISKNAEVIAEKENPLATAE